MISRPPDRLEPWEADLWYEAIAILERNHRESSEDEEKRDAARASAHGGGESDDFGRT